MSFLVPKWLKGSRGSQKRRKGRDAVRGIRRGADKTYTAISELVSSETPRYKEITADEMYFVAKNDALGNRCTYAVAKDALENWFIVTDFDDKQIDNLNIQAQEFAERTNLRKKFIEWVATQKWSGWAILVDWEAQGYKPRGESFEVFSKRDCTITYDKNTGERTNYKVRVDLGDTFREIDVPPDFVYFADSIGGFAPLNAAFHDIACHRNLGYCVGQTFFRFGQGFPVLSVPEEGNTTPDDITAMEKKFRNIHDLEGMVLDVGYLLEFKGAQGAALNPEPYSEVILKRVAAASRIPKALLIGADAGALAASRTNQTDYWKLLKSDQGEWRWNFEEVLVKSGGLPDTGWKLFYGHPDPSELDKLDMAMKKEEINIARLAYWTINEVRIDNDKPPLDGYDVIQGSINISMGEEGEEELEEEKEETVEEEEESEKKLKEEKKKERAKDAKETTKRKKRKRK